MTPAAHVAVGAVRVYQWTVRPVIGANCRFFPSCSDYAIDAFRTHGALRGSGLAARRIYDPLLEAGAEIFEWNGVMLHAKTVVIDGVISMCGSSNLDPLSLRRNYELNVLVADAKAGADMRAQFTSDIRSATSVTLAEWRKRPWLYKAAEWLAGLLEWNM